MPSPNYINPSVLAAEALDQLDYELVAGSLVYRDKTADFSTVRGMKVGKTIDIRTVSDFETTDFDGVSIDIQNVQQSSTQLEIEKHFDVSVEVGAEERALNLDGIRKEIINPAMTSMAQKIDTYLLTKITESQGLFASASLLSDAGDIALARQAANIQQIPMANRIGLVNDVLEAQLLGQDVFSKFDTRGQPGVTALQEASMGRLMGINWFSSLNMPTVSETIGTATGILLDNTLDLSNLQGNSKLVVDGTASGTLVAGDKIQIAGAKRNFTVKTAVPDVTGIVEIELEEEINEKLNSGPLVGLDNAAITVIGSDIGTVSDYQGIIFVPGAYGFAAPPLDAAAGDLAGVASADGLSIRMTEAYDINTKKTIWSFDMLVGAAAVDARKSIILGAVA